MNKSIEFIFLAKDYRNFLFSKLESKESIRGTKSKLCDFLKIQTSFLSHVLKGRAEMSLDQAYKTAEFFSLNHIETEFFMILVQKEKAGTQSLKNYFDSKLKKIKEDQSTVKEKIQVHGEVEETQKNIYYQSWVYAAVHLLTAFSDTKTTEKISKKLKLPLEYIEKIVEFLVKSSLIEEVGGKLQIGKGRVHLDKQSPLIIQHHTQWRLKAIQSLELPKQNDLHFSSLYGIAEKDIEELKHFLLDLTSKSERVLKQSSPEKLVVMNLDLFEI